jgi:sugar phosphate isomerase/epimerase
MFLDYPKIYLAIDNCFASKRWTDPEKWMEVIKELGVYYVEASADNECDPLYMGMEYLDDWAEQVITHSRNLGMKVANLYSGHGTYATLGLAHTDVRVRDRFLNDWLKPMAETAGRIGAGLGFFCHAFCDMVLQDKGKYEDMEEDLYARLADLAIYARNNGYGPLGVEQMYTPHQIPWTIKSAKKLLKEVYRKSNSPFYITIDVGHQSGQRKFLRPGYGQIKEMLRQYRYGNRVESLWLGPKSAFKIFEEAAALPEGEEDAAIYRIESEMDHYPYMFAAYEDGNPYIWLEKLGRYSPIIHLQQTDGKSSSHLPFTKENNDRGIISPEKLFRALASSYLNNNEEETPPCCKDIYLTLEMFTGTVEINRYAIMKLKETVGYWRQYIPKDGLPLAVLINMGGKNSCMI